MNGIHGSLVFLPGDGVGPEVTAAAGSVLQEVANAFGHRLEIRHEMIGGAAMDATGDPLPAATLAACDGADAVLLGAVGGPKWSDPNAAVRPEQGLLRLRQHYELFANLRPVPVFPAVAHLAPLKAELLEDVDILFVRELVSGVYFGERREQGDGVDAYDTMSYSVAEVERVAHVAFQAARRRRHKVTSVDKANVLASMRLWRRTVEAVAADYPDVELEHALVDSCAMRLLTAPGSFDVVLAGNLFGDVLSDEAAVLAGSLGLLPSASLGATTTGATTTEKGTFGVYEPIHGSAPDIAGRGIANPLGAILSVAMLLRYSLGLEEEARTVEEAVASALTSGARTADLGPDGLSTAEMTAAVVAGIGATVCA